MQANVPCSASRLYSSWDSLTSEITSAMDINVSMCGHASGSPTASTTSSSNWSSVLSLSGMSASTGSGGREGGIAPLDDMQAAALRRHLEAMREKLDDVCDEIILVKV